MIEDTGVWLSFQLAAEEVERRLGLTLGVAQKTLLELCESGEVRWQPISHGYTDISRNDLRRWLQEKLTRETGGKQSRIAKQLAEMFPERVPNRTNYPRQALTAELIKRDHSLHPLNLKTLARAIETHNRQVSNRQLGNARNTGVSG
jgi:hypothetical protein